MLGLVLFVAVIVTAIKDGLEGGFAVLIFGGFFYALAWGVWFAYRYDVRRKQRQQQRDRDRALAINADIEDSAYARGDDERGMYGQFPPAV